MSITSTQKYIATPLGQLFSQAWQVKSCDKAPIILLHDSLGCVELWRDFPSQLAHMTQRTVIAYDRLGFGKSSLHPAQLDADFVVSEAIEDFKALLAAYEVNNFVVMGHSVGGGMAVACAAAYPQQCVALITEAAQAFNDEKIRQEIQAAANIFQNPQQLARLAKYHAEKAQWVLDAWVSTWLSPAFEHWHIDQQAALVQAPSLILHGELDEYGSLAQPERFKANLADLAQVHIIQGGHHILHKQQPDLVLKIIQDFLARVA